MSVKNLSCPYCKKRTTREKLVNHIDYNHSNELPEGFSALRMAFHVANNKPLEYRRPCRICKQPTEWDEKKGRYNFLCGNPECKEKYVAFMKKSMGEKYGAYRPTATPEGLEKMLAARKISGKYKWSDGTIFTYTGSYELATLKFMDRGLEIKSEDLMVPGPILEYEYNGEKHLYISDIYYRPYNLLIEVKDGGTSVNKNKEFAITRAKQIAKEKYVIEKTDYNYLRLTDKDCAQLMAVFADLKMHLVEKDKERVIHVNENTPIAAVNPIIGFVPSRDVVVINYMKKKTFVDDSDYVIADSPKFDTIFARDKDGVLRKKDKSILHGSYYTPYIVRDKRQQISEALSENIDKEVSESFIYETVFGHPIFSKDQIKYENCESYTDYYQDLEDIKNYINEASKEASKLDKDFKKKTGKEFIIKDINDPYVDKYMKKDAHMKGMIEWYRKAKSKSGEVAIDTEDDIIVGYVLVKDNGVIGPLYVAKKYRGYGLSHNLIMDAISKYNGKELGVYKDNEIAQKLYKSHGFKKKETKTEDKTGEKYFIMSRESTLVTEDTKASDDFIKVEKFNRELNKFKYISNAEKTLSSAEFEKQKGGTCWDYVNYEYKFFKRNHIPVDAYMFVMDRGSGDIVTHTFCIITIDNEKHWFESAWKKWKGIYEKDLNSVVRELVDHYGKHSYSVFKYTPGDGLENVSNNSFFDKSTQNLVKDVVVKEVSVTEKDLEKNAKLKPIFTVSVFSGSPFAKLLSKTTEMKFSHALISLNSDLSTMYSFDYKYTETDQFTGKITRFNGLVKDNFKRYKEDMGNYDMRVVAIMVTPKVYKEISDNLNYYLKHSEDTKYGVTKLAKTIIGNNRLSSFGDMQMICSEFVDAILKKSKIDISGKSSANTTPSDLGTFKDRNNFFQVYEGKIKDYDYKKINKMIESMKQNMKFRDLQSQRKNSMKDAYDHNIGSINNLPKYLSISAKNAAKYAKKKVLGEDGHIYFMYDE